MYIFHSYLNEWRRKQANIYYSFISTNEETKDHRFHLYKNKKFAKQTFTDSIHINKQ